MPATAEHYRVLKRPVVTEKSSVQMSDYNCYAFEVAPDANKAMIADAVRNIFGVKVKGVRTIKMKGRRNLRNRFGYFDESNWKKALITLEEGQSIEIS